MSCPTERRWSSSCRLSEVGVFLNPEPSRIFILLLFFFFFMSHRQVEVNRCLFRVYGNRRKRPDLIKQARLRQSIWSRHVCLKTQLKWKVTLAYWTCWWSGAGLFPVNPGLFPLLSQLNKLYIFNNEISEGEPETSLFCSQWLFSPKSCSGKLNRQTIM